MIETRYRVTTEVRASKGPAGPRLEGYASVFNQPTQLPGFRETIRSTAFDRALKEKHDAVALWNHNADMPLGRVSSGTLRLNTDSRGLHFVVDLPNTSWGKDAHESVRVGNVTGTSFGFMVDDPAGQTWSEQKADDGTHYIQRDIHDLKLLDISPATFPAYSGTDIQARAIQPPAELRSRVLRYGFIMPTVAECLEITRRAEERHQREAAEARNRRNNLLNQVL